MPEKAAGQRQKMREAKVNLLRAHPHALRRAERDFQHIPFLVLEVDEQALRKLLADDNVASVEENSPVERTTIESTAIVGSRTANLRGFSGSGWSVVVIDDGVESTHPFVKNTIVDSP